MTRPLPPARCAAGAASVWLPRGNPQAALPSAATAVGWAIPTALKVLAAAAWALSARRAAEVRPWGASRAEAPAGSPPGVLRESASALHCPRLGQNHLRRQAPSPADRVSPWAAVAQRGRAAALPAPEPDSRMRVESLRGGWRKRRHPS